MPATYSQLNEVTVDTAMPGDRIIVLPEEGQPGEVRFVTVLSHADLDDEDDVVVLAAQTLYRRGKFSHSNPRHETTASLGLTRGRYGNRIARAYRDERPEWRQDFWLILDTVLCFLCAMLLAAAGLMINGTYGWMLGLVPILLWVILQIIQSRRE